MKNSRDGLLSTSLVTGLPPGVVHAVPETPLMRVSSLAVSSDVIVMLGVQYPPLARLVSLSCSVSRPISWKVVFRPSLAFLSLSSLICAHADSFCVFVIILSKLLRIVSVVAPPHKSDDSVGW